MKKMLISEAARVVGGKVINDNKGYISSGCIDSRKPCEGALFIAIKGENTDGHKYINGAVKNGASAALVSYVPDDVTCPCIVVEDTTKALQELARYYRSTLKAKVVGISGSVGKTSTKEIVASVLSAKYKVHKTIGNFNNELGLPLTVLDVEEDTEILVLEMGISDFGEMRLLSSIAHPDVCVLTNIGQAHLEALGSRDGILKAKTEMFEYMNEGAAIFVCGDDDKLITVKNDKCSRLVRFGFGPENDVYATNVNAENFYGSTFTLNFKDRSFDAGMRIIGEHMISNAAAAAAIGEYLGLSDEEIVKGLEAARTIKGRCYLIEHGKGFIVDDCYNASPDSMIQSINLLDKGEGHRVLVLGDMLELGSETEKMHYEIGKYAAAHDFDKAILVGELAENILQGIKDSPVCNIKEVIYLKSTDELVERINELAPIDSNVMFKASNGMHFSKAIKELAGDKY